MELNHFAGGAYAMSPPLATLPPLHHCRYYFHKSGFIVARQPQALMSCINFEFYVLATRMEMSITLNMAETKTTCQSMLGVPLPPQISRSPTSPTPTCALSRLSRRRTRSIKYYKSGLLSFLYSVLTMPHIADRVFCAGGS